MKPAPFQYKRPATLDEAIRLLVTDPNESKLLAGGQSLIPLMAFRLVRPAVLVDISRLPGLDHIEMREGKIRLGANATHRRIELHAEVRELCPIIAEALRHVGHVAIRNAGTIGGSLAHADPAAEWPAVILALDGAVEVSGPSGERRISADEFFLDWMTTVLSPDEIITNVELTTPPIGAGWAFLEIARRQGDFALAGVAAVLGVIDGVVAHVRLGLLGAGLTPVRAFEAEQSLLGHAATAEQFRQAAEAVRDTVTPVGDQHGSASYRRKLAGILTVRALELAATRGQEARP